MENVEDEEGSAEKLLGDGELEETDELTEDTNDHEDDDIAKLMGFQDDPDARLKASTSEYSLKSGDDIDMQVIRPVVIRNKSVEIKTAPQNVAVPQSVTSYRPLPTAILNRQAKMQKMYAKHSSQTGKIICGILCIFIILGIGAVLLLLAYTRDMRDLYIIGGIFACGGVLFTLTFIVLRCTEDRRLTQTDYSALYKSPV